MSAIGILRSFAEARCSDHDPIPARLTYGTIREALRLIEERERSAELACESPPPGNALGVHWRGSGSVVDAPPRPAAESKTMRWLTLGLVTMAVGCGGEAVEAPGSPDTGASGGWAAVPPLAEPGGAGGLGGAGGAPPATEPEEPAPEPWKPEPRPEPLPGRPGFGDPCQRPSDCEIPGVTGENSLICHAGRCGFLCDRWQGLDIVPSEYLERLCASEYGRVCTYGAAHPERDACVR